LKEEEEEEEETSCYGVPIKSGSLGRGIGSLGWRCRRERERASGLDHLRFGIYM